MRIPGLLFAALVLGLSGCGGSPSSSSGSGTTVIELSVADAAAIESAASIDFILHLNVALTSAITVDYQTADASAQAGLDYTATSGTATIPSGSQNVTVSVPLLNDTLSEGNETFTLNLSNVTAGVTLANSSAIGTIIDDDGPTLSGFDDTGMTSCGGESGGLVQNGLSCPQTAYPGQDGDNGRDVSANNPADGLAGFSFTKLDASGAPLTDQTQSYAVQPWACVRDEVTGLTWEVKTADGSLRDGSWTYTWYQGDAAGMGLDPGVANGGSCVDSSSCDTEKYVSAVNAAALCGYTDWRLPTRTELQTLVDFDRTNSGSAAIDTGYFPNTSVNWYWTANRSVYYASAAWGISFATGLADQYSSALIGYLRLVRGGS